MEKGLRPTSPFLTPPCLSHLCVPDDLLESRGLRRRQERHTCLQNRDEFGLVTGRDRREHSPCMARDV
jgi:hypothetical protein